MEKKKVEYDTYTPSQTKSSQSADMCCDENCRHHQSHTILIVLLVLSLILSALSLYFLAGGMMKGWRELSGSGRNELVGIEKVVYDAVMKIEYEKVWGQKNYDLIQKANLMQLQSQIPEIEKYVNGTQNPNTNTQTQNNNPPTQTATPATKDITPEAITTLYKDAYIEGNPNADITIFEYSDLECPFCIRHESDGTVKTVLAKYGDKVNHVFKNNRGVNHPGTEAKALATLCAWKVGGREKYASFYHAIFAKSSLQSALEVSKLPDVAKEVWLDVTKWQSCVDNKETSARFTAETAEANMYGLSGTPGSLILNKKTGEYITIEGAYPSENFIAAIDTLMK